MIGKCRYALQALFVLALAPQWGFGQANTESLLRETHHFRQVFDLQGCKALTDPGELFDNPTETVLVILGDTTILQGLRIGDYVDRGGSLLLATDRGLVHD